MDGGPRRADDTNEFPLAEGPIRRDKPLAAARLLVSALNAASDISDMPLDIPTARAGDSQDCRVVEGMKGSGIMPS